MNEIRISAAALLRGDGATLLVRKQGTKAFMQPGGKIDAGETPLQALCRELHEELGLRIAADLPRHLGRFSAPAAHEPESLVIAEIFSIALDQPVTARAEIAEAIWVTPDSAAALPLAPLTRDCVLPLIWPAARTRAEPGA